MRTSKTAMSLAMVAMLASCGGGGNNNNAGTPTPTPPPVTDACSYTAQADFVRRVFNEWYLFPDLLNTSVNAANYNNLNDYIDALVAPARAENKDRFFSYATSIEAENAFFNGGSSAGLGIRLFYDFDERRVFVAETFDNTPALAAGIDRGTEILAIGTTASNLQTVNSLLATGGGAAVSDALGPNEPGVTRVLRIRDRDGNESTVTVTKAEYALDPVPRYGAQIINDGGRRVGYVRLTNFINPAIDELRTAFATFRAEGITEYVVDLRYNGGGGVNVNEYFGDLFARNLDGEIFETIAFRDSKSSNNETYRFQARPQSVAPTRIAFIGDERTASASEALINGLQPYLGDNLALVGSNTFGKPVGQSAFDLADCDLRVRAVTLKLENANGQGEYFNGLATTVPNFCPAPEVINRQFGDPQESLVSVALDFLEFGSCPSTTTRTTTSADRLRMLQPERPSTVLEREIQGGF